MFYVFLEVQVTQVYAGGPRLMQRSTYDLYISLYVNCL